MHAGDLDLQAMTPEQRAPYLRAASHYSMLTRTADTAEAESLAKALTLALDDHQRCTGGRTNRRGEAALAKLQRAVAAFVGDLLAAEGWGAWGGLIYRSTQTNSFSRTPVTADNVRALLAYLTSEGLAERYPGFSPAKHDFGDGVKVALSKAQSARFRATPRLLVLAEQHGVVMGYAGDHFPLPARPIPEPPRVVLKSAKRRTEAGYLVPSVDMPIPDCPEVQAIQAQLATISRFLEGVDIAGGTYRGFFRQFEHGDAPAFRWNMGGRLYAVGRDAYQQQKKAKRLAMCLDGEPVVEIDIRASYLTILHGLMQEPIDLSKDPYEIAGFDRSVVKTWITASITNGKPLERWSARHKEDFASDHPGRSLTSSHKPRAVEAAVMLRHPILRDLTSLGASWPELMFVESEAIIATMLDLIEAGVPSLPVHDSILVPATRETLAMEVLTRRFEQKAGITPTLEVRRNEGP
jgi:hypothetical protein